MDSNLVIVLGVIIALTIVFILWATGCFSSNASNSSVSRKWGLAGFHPDTRIVLPKNENDRTITQETKPAQCEIGGTRSTNVKPHYPVLSLNSRGRDVLRRVESVFESSSGVPCVKITFKGLNGNSLVVSKSLSIFGVNGKNNLQAGKLKIGDTISTLKINNLEECKYRVRTFRFAKARQPFFIEMDTVKIKCEGLGPA